MPCSPSELQERIENNQDLQDYTEVVRMPLPEPSFCEKKLWDIPPKCLTTYEPRVGPSLAEHVVFPSSLPEILSLTTQMPDWHIRLIEGDVKAIKKAKKKKLGYTDRKWALQGTPESGPLLLRFNVTRADTFFFLCHGPTQLANSPLDKYLSVRVDGKNVNLLMEDEARKEGVVNFSFGKSYSLDEMQCFVSRQTFSAREHIIEIIPVVKDGTSHYIPLTHFIWW